MIKALLIVGMVGMSGEHTTEMPSMEECLEMRTIITEQDPDVKTLCVPVAHETAKMQEFFWLFMDMIDHMKAHQLEWDTLNDTIRSGENKPTDSVGLFR